MTHAQKNLWWLVVAPAVLLAVVLAFFWASARPDAPRADRKPVVVTTLFPLYDFARQVGGDDVEVSLLLPPGVEPHAFEPTPSDLVKINDADLFVYTGPSMEPWAEDVLAALRNDRLRVVDAGLGVRTIPAAAHDEDEPAGAPDPHVWLDFDNDAVIVESVTAALVAADPDRAAAYRARAEAYVKALAEADAKFYMGLSRCARRDVVYGGHYAFGYLAARYGLKYRAAQGLAPDAEPSARDIAALIDQVRNEKLPYVFYEELVSPKIAETLAAETGAGLLFLNAAHNVSRDQLFGGVTFLGIMKDNLANLQLGLGCEK